MHQKITLIRIASLFLIFSSWSCLAVPCGSVLLARGEVEVITKHSSHLVQAGQILNCGDIIVSRNGAATIEIARGKLVIGTYSRLEIAVVAETKGEAEVNALNLIYGRTRVLIQKKSESRFEVRTPSATAGVRGTDFFVSHDPAGHVSHEATIEGQVEVSKFDSNEPPILASGGEQVDVSIEPEVKAKPLESQPVSDAIKEDIRQTSGVAKDDPDFTQHGAVQALGDPKTWETGGLTEEVSPPLQRLTVGIGPQWGMVFHNTSGLDGQVASGGIFSAQYERSLPKNEGAWLVAVTLGNMKDKGDNSYGVRNQYSMVNFETGIRLDHTSWWSPYIKLGVGFMDDNLTINRPDLNYFLDRTDHGMNLIGTMGLDARYNWNRKFGLFGKMEAQLAQTLLTTQSIVNNYNQSATGVPDQAAGNGVRGTSLGLSAVVGVLGQF